MKYLPLFSFALLSLNLFAIVNSNNSHAGISDKIKSKDESARLITVDSSSEDKVYCNPWGSTAVGIDLEHSKEAPSLQIENRCDKIKFLTAFNGNSLLALNECNQTLIRIPFEFKAENEEEDHSIVPEIISNGTQIIDAAISRDGKFIYAIQFSAPSNPWKILIYSVTGNDSIDLIYRYELRDTSISSKAPTDKPSKFLIEKPSKILIDENSNYLFIFSIIKQEIIITKLNKLTGDINLKSPLKLFTGFFNKSEGRDSPREAPYINHIQIGNSGQNLFLMGPGYVFSISLEPTKPEPQDAIEILDRNNDRPLIVHPNLNLFYTIEKDEKIDSDILLKYQYNSVSHKFQPEKLHTFNKDETISQIEIFDDSGTYKIFTVAKPSPWFGNARIDMFNLDSKTGNITTTESLEIFHHSPSIKFFIPSGAAK